MKKQIAVKLIAGMIAATTLFSAPVMASSTADSNVQKSVYTENGVTWIEGMVEEKNTWQSLSPNISFFLQDGRKTQYPAEGGKWQYGFWNTAVHSYYTVNKNHGSTAVYIDVMGKKHVYKSINTRAGKTSNGEGWALNLPKSDDKYYYRIAK